MLSALLTLTLAATTLAEDPVPRDSYGVPVIAAPSVSDAFEQLGQAVAEDRLWQLEMSRRSARGRLAEVMGTSAVAGDRQVRLSLPREDEVEAQIEALPADIRAVFEAYARGINAVIDERTANGTLPPGYAEMDFAPEPWTPLDSAYVTIQLVRSFGERGAGELRNLAVLRYLQTQPARDDLWVIFDDLLWQNDPRSPVTVEAEDDPVNSPPTFPQPDREEAQRVLDALADYTLFDLLPLVTQVERQNHIALAESVGAPYKMGSYAVVVGPERSANGRPMLLTAPEMGHREVNVGYEAMLETPDWTAAGLHIPGVPALVIASTLDFAWGLTSGVADLTDFYAIPAGAEDFTTETFTIEVRGGEPVTVTRQRSVHGLVIANKAGASHALVQTSSVAGRELSSLAGVFGLLTAKSPDDVEALAGQFAASFNVFYATAAGDIGYRYAGLVPTGSGEREPRLPRLTPPPASPRYLAPEQMPHVINPAAGLLTNWNNKPVAWWDNTDSPVWGHLFRVDALRAALPSGPVSRLDLERAAFAIARMDGLTLGVFAGWADLLPEELAPARLMLERYAGARVLGTIEPVYYDLLVNALRDEIFRPHIGNFLSPALYAQAISPSVIDRALRGETEFDFLGDRTMEEVFVAAAGRALEQFSALDRQGFNPSSIPDGEGGRIPYGSRGTVIFITELAPGRPMMRTVLNPGQAESGPHQRDQAPLAASWSYKISPISRIRPR